MFSEAPGCAASEKVCKLHYWYAQAEGTEAEAAAKPVVLWLNGGPGSSSVLGMLAELGPLLTNSSGGLMVNPYAWTKEANLVILESPMGVGYSYCSSQAAPGGKGVCKNTDKLTASAARAAMVDFFSSKFRSSKATTSSSRGRATLACMSRLWRRRSSTTPRDRST